jgi:hypothetical protein
LGAVAVSHTYIRALCGGFTAGSGAPSPFPPRRVINQRLGGAHTHQHGASGLRRHCHNNRLRPGQHRLRCMHVPCRAPGTCYVHGQPSGDTQAQLCDTAVLDGHGHLGLHHVVDHDKQDTLVWGRWDCGRSMWARRDGTGSGPKTCRGRARAHVQAHTHARTHTQTRAQALRVIRTQPSHSHFLY